MRAGAIGFLLVFFLRVGFLSAQTSSPAIATGAFVDVDGSRLYYEECGSGPKAVVLLHDGVVNSAVWDDVWPAFCKQFHAIRYDRRGYGRSPATKKPYFEADDVAALLHDRKVSQAALVASSHGGNIALGFALRYPAQVSELVLIGPEAEGFPYSEQFVMNQIAFQNAKDQTEVRVQSTYFIVPGNDAAREHLRMPTLILVGSGDIADNQAVAGALVMEIPGAARVVVPDTGHLMYLEKPDVFFSLVNEFLKSHGF